MSCSLFIFLLTSCEEEIDTETKVVTEDVVYLSGERVRLTGRVLSLAFESAENHGFQISKDENFNNSIVVELGPKGSLGRYVGDFDNLMPDTEYFCRAFVSDENGLITGNIVSLQTLQASLNDFTPKIGRQIDKVILLGSNLSSDVKVFFGDKEAEVISVEFESKVTVRVPSPLPDAYSVPVRVIQGAQELVYGEEFEYETGLWKEVAEFFNDEQYSETVTLTHNDKLIFGLGKDGDGLINNKVWSLDLQNLLWTESTFTATSRFPFATSSYFGSGAISFLFGKNYSNEFWHYDGDFNYKGETPFKLYQSIGIETQEDVYVLGGSTELDENNFNIYRYSKSSEVWNIEGIAPFAIKSFAPHVELDGVIYVYNKEENAIWTYSIEDNLWEYFITLPDTFTNGGLAFEINSKIYFGLFNLDDRLWELDVTSRQWKPMIEYPGSKGDETVGYALYDNKLLLLKNRFVNSSESQLPMSVWSFDPEKL